MRIWNFKPNGDLFTTVAVGAAVAAAPVIVPLAWTAVRPLLKIFLKGGFILYENGREVYTTLSGWSLPETAPMTPTTKRVGAKTQIRPTGREERALAQNLGLIEEQSVGVEKRPATSKARHVAKTSAKKTEKKK